MATLGKVLAVFNVLAAIGFLFVAGKDYYTRQSWAYRTSGTSWPSTACRWTRTMRPAGFPAGPSPTSSARTLGRKCSATPTAPRRKWTS